MTPQEEFVQVLSKIALEIAIRKKQAKDKQEGKTEKTD